MKISQKKNFDCPELLGRDFLSGSVGEYYHSVPKSKIKEILEDGLYPTNADECSQNQGIHVTGGIVEARYWADKLRAERKIDEEMVILEIKIDGEELREDEFKEKPRTLPVLK